MIVNLFDNTFRHDVCSTAFAVPAHFSYVRDQYRHDGVTLFVDGFTDWASSDHARSPVRLGWLHEPRCLIPELYERAPANASRFDAVLTYDAELLRLPGFRFMPYGGVWIERRHWGIGRKSALCSQLVGAKTATPGHQMRHRVAALGMFPQQFGVYGQAVDYSAETKRRVNQPYYFTIVTETCRSENLFTEWLLDCFAVGTVPIFWGCPNVGEFFDPAGILSFETAEQCAELVAGLSVGLYHAMLPAIRHNLRMVEQYSVAEDWLYANVLKAYDHA